MPRELPPRRPRPLRAVPLEPAAAESVSPAPPPPPPPPPASVVVSFEGPRPQGRATIAFRAFLAIPHFIYGYILLLVTYVAVFIGWFAALALGRMPTGLATFIARIIGYSARVYAYAWHLLTDRYPPFALDAPDYPVSVEVTPTRLNRAAVLFRFILVIPATIVNSVVTSGAIFASFVVWLIVLIKGRPPAALFEAEAAVLRYSVRYYAYAAMLTGEYPRGLFGDQADAPPAAELELPAQPRISRLVLSKAGRRIVLLFIVLGSVFGVGAFGVSISNSIRSGEAFDKVSARHDELGVEVLQFQTRAPSCAVSGGPECLHSANTRLADAFGEFARELALIKFPLIAQDAGSELLEQTENIIAALRGLASINDQSQYQAAAVEWQQMLLRFGALYEELVLLL